MLHMENQRNCSVIMYHYVRNVHETKYPRLKACSLGKFEKQMDYLSKNSNVISLNDYVSYLDGNVDIPQNSTVLSFDDGLKDHYENVFPILKSKGFSATFFPITSCMDQFKVPIVQKVQFLLAELGSIAFANEFNSSIKNKFPELYHKFKVTDAFNEKTKRRWDDVLTSNLKYNIGSLDFDIKDIVVGNIFNKIFKEEDSFCRELYMNYDEMKEMLEHKMTFGGHTHTHPILSTLDKENQRYELRKSKQILEKNLGTEIKLFSYPNGRFNEDTLKLLKDEKYSCALSTKVKLNEGLVDKFQICRFDANDVPTA